MTRIFSCRVHFREDISLKISGRKHSRANLHVFFRRINQNKSRHPSRKSRSDRNVSFHEIFMVRVEIFALAEIKETFFLLFFATKEHFSHCGFLQLRIQWRTWRWKEKRNHLNVSSSRRFRKECYSAGMFRNICWAILLLGELNKRQNEKQGRKKFVKIRNGS